MTLEGVSVPTEDDGAMREMAECFVEEYSRMGFDPDRIFKMFKVQGYAGPSLAYQVLGEQTIRSIIRNISDLRGVGRLPSRQVERDRQPVVISQRTDSSEQNRPSAEDGDIALPVLDRFQF